jgi:hypothetical protein
MTTESDRDDVRTDGRDGDRDGANAESLHAWDLPWSIRLAVPAAIVFVGQMAISLLVGRPVGAALFSAVVMAGVCAVWLRWRLPITDAKRQAQLQEVGRGGWANPTRYERFMARWFWRRRRSEVRNPLSGDRPPRR